MKRTLLLVSSAAIIGLVLSPPVWARGFGGGGGGRGGYGGGRGGYGGGGYHGGGGGYHGEGGYHGGEGGHGGGYGGYHGSEGGYHGGEAGHGNYEDGFHGGEGYHGQQAGGYGQHPGSFSGQAPMAGSAAGHGLDNQLFGSQGAGKNLSNVNPSNLQGAGKNLNNLNGSNLSNLQGAGKNLNNLNGSNLSSLQGAGQNLNGSHLQQQQPWNNWYQGHGNWGNGQVANAASAWGGSGLGAAATGWGAAGLAAAATVPGWGLGSAYYDSGYGSYYNPYSSGDDGSSGYNYSQPVQTVQYSAPSQSAQGDGNAASGSSSNAPTASDEALRFGQKARLAFKDQDYTGALNDATLALKQMPGDPGLHEFRALALFALGQYQPAAAAVHSILAVGPGWNWTTMIGLYGDDTATYTKQLRALESDIMSNPDSSADHFLLAYQYLCCNQSDAAALQLKKVIELTPKDQLAPQLLATITKSTDTSTPSVPATSTEKPLNASALVGDWTSRRDDGSTIELKVTSDSKFTWTYTANGKTQTFAGTAADVNGLLALQRADGNAMMAHVTATDGGGFRFRLISGSATDPGLVFTH